MRDIGEARLILAGPEGTESAGVAAAGAPRTVRYRVSMLALPVVAVIAAIAGWLATPCRPHGECAAVDRLPDGQQVTTVPAITADGRTIAFAAGRSAATYPFFSPDGRFVAFFAGGRLRLAPVRGGAATSLVAVSKGWGATWTDDDHIVYVPGLNAGLWQVISGEAEGLAASTITHRLSALSQLFEVLDGDKPYNPVRGIVRLTEPAAKPA